MPKRKFSTAILDTLLNAIEVDFKVPLGIADVKFPVSDYAKGWWENEKAEQELLQAIESAEEKFVLENPTNRAAQILYDFSLKNEKDFQKIVISLIKELEEEKITQFTAVKLRKGFESVISKEALHHALNDYLPYLHGELRKLKAFREVITAILVERIDKTTQRIESDLAKNLEMGQKIYSEVVSLSARPTQQQAKGVSGESINQISLLDYIKAVKNYAEGITYNIDLNLLGSNYYLLPRIELISQPSSEQEDQNDHPDVNFAKIHGQETTLADFFTDDCNTLILYGEAGVGKTSFLRYAAQNVWDKPEAIGLEENHTIFAL